VIRINLLVLCNVDLNQKWGDYTRIFSLMGEFSKLGHHVFMIIIRPENKKPRISSFKENGIEVTQIHPPQIGLRGEKGLSRHLKYLACLPTVSKIASKIIKENDIDHVYSYMPGTGSSVPAMRIKSKHKIKFVLDLADMYTLVRPKIVVERSFKKADKILTITEYLKKDLISKRIDSNKIYILPNGVDLELFNPIRYDKNEIQNFRKTFNAEKLIVFVGSLQDLNIIINSAEQVTKSILGVKYIIIGDHRDPNRSTSIWKDKVKEKKLSEYFEFLGKKPREEIPKYILCADVCVDSFPNEPYYAAAHPIKLLEYGACAKPVVATKVSETAKIVKHGEFGYLATPSDSKEYADYLIKLLESPKVAEKMGKNFSDFIRKEFSWDYLASKLERYLTS